MSKRNAVTKLLAVAVVSLSGCEQLGPPLPASTTPTAPITSSAPEAPDGSAGVTAPGTAAATPRTMNDGRPACGNVHGRVTEQMVRQRERECAKPRTHRNGSPAEGNVTSRTAR